MKCIRCDQPFEIRIRYDGKPFKIDNQKYCSTKCRRLSHRERYPDLYVQRTIKTQATGAISEMQVAASLMGQGWSVFRSICSASEFDLVAFRAGKTLKIEVKTGYRQKNGNLYIPRHDHAEHDVMAIVVRGTDEIVYRPSLDAI